MNDSPTSDAAAPRSRWRTCFTVGMAVLLLLAYEAGREALSFLNVAFSEENYQTFETAIATAFWIFLAVSINDLLRIFVWNGVMRRRRGIPAPKLLTQLVGLALWVTTAVILMAVVYDVPVTGFLTTSGIIIAVIGFALRNLIADVFTGIALGIEQPLRIGDWVQFADETPGKVVEINWRAARLETLEEVFQNVNKVIIDGDSGGGSGVVPYLPLPEIQKRMGGASNATGSAKQ